jgi:hypothetical protein
MPDEPSSDRKGGFLAFWTTLPGILTGVAALITAIVGAVGLWKSQGGGSGMPSPASQPASTVATETLSSQAKAPGLLAQGRLTLVRSDWADLERGQIGPSTTNADVIFGPETTPILTAAASAFLAPVRTQPTKRSCTTALSTRHDPSEIVSQVDTSWVCVSTAEGNVAV